MTLAAQIVLCEVWTYLLWMFWQVSSVEVVQAYIDRIQDVNPLINAVVKDRQGPTIRLYSTFFFHFQHTLLIPSQLNQPDALFSLTQVTAFTYYCLTKNQKVALIFNQGMAGH